MEETELDWGLDNGYTLARSYIRLDNFRDQPLSQDLLERIERGFNAARMARIKIIPRLFS